MLRKLQNYFIPLSILVFYLVFHLVNLTILPIFADEAIYIRWAQLILDEPSRYLFFPLNDGKTPLFIWSQLPFLTIFDNPLFATRFLSVLVGFFQVITMGQLAWILSKNKKAEYLAMLLTTILPFWFFHHRMGLMDGMMTLFLSLSFLFSLKAVASIPTAIKKADFISQAISIAKTKNVILFSLLSGLCFGLALWSKLPALLFVPSLLLWSFINIKRDKNTLFSVQNILLKGLLLSFSIGLGLIIFVLLKINPAFSQLFARGSDFLYPFSEVIQGTWKQTLPNIPTYFMYLWQYMTWPVLLLASIGLFLPQKKLTFHLLFWSGIVFFFPIALLGKVVYPRYFLPLALPLTLSASIVLSELVEKWVSSHKEFKIKLLASIVVVTFVGGIVNQSSLFMLPALFQPNQTPFVPADQVQYLTEWSSGHGVTQSVELIQGLAQDHSVAVATEGFFGTLPDAVSDYLHNQDVSNIYIEGIGQPVRSIPSNFIERAQTYDQTLLLVNSHRLEITLEEKYRVARYCRPLQAPCLEVWDISHLVNPKP